MATPRTGLSPSQGNRLFIVVQIDDGPTLRTAAVDEVQHLRVDKPVLRDGCAAYLPFDWVCRSTGKSCRATGCSQPSPAPNYILASVCPRRLLCQKGFRKTKNPKEEAFYCLFIPVHPYGSSRFPPFIASVDDLHTPLACIELPGVRVCTLELPGRPFLPGHSSLDKTDDTLGSTGLVRLSDIPNLMKCGRRKGLMRRSSSWIPCRGSIESIRCTLRDAQRS